MNKGLIIVLVLVMGALGVGFFLGGGSDFRVGLSPGDEGVSHTFDQITGVPDFTESDPTVAASVKDGVSWGEVSGKPDLSGWNGIGGVPAQIVIPYKTNYVAQTRGFWSNGARHNDFNCDAPSQGFSGFTFVMDGNYVDVSGRGTCALAPSCDSFQEFCKDFVVTKSCWINNEFFNWYEGRFGRNPPC